MINDREMKLARLALDPAAQKGEIDNAAIMFFRSLRGRGIMAEQFRIGNTSEQNKRKKNIFPDWGKNANLPFDAIDHTYLRWILRVWFPKLDDEGKQSWSWLKVEIEEYLS